MHNFNEHLLIRYEDAPVEVKPYRQKDGALLAIGALCDKLKQIDPYKSELERMLAQRVFPEFNSPIGHLRAKVSFFKFSFLSFLIMHENAIYLIGKSLVNIYN